MSLIQLKTILGGLVDWLLSEPVPRPAGTGAGVADYLHPDGGWDGPCPEICRYRLQFVTRAAFPDGKDAPFRLATARVAAWLDAASGIEAAPLTLYRRDMALSDWRNLSLFAFGLSILLRGLTVAETRWPRLMPAGTIERYAASAARISQDGRLASHRLRRGASAAGVPVNRFARDGEMRMHELHPFLYFMEGWLTLRGRARNPQALDHATRAFGMRLGQVDPNTGAPGRAGASGRLALEAARQLDGAIGRSWRTRRQALAAALLACVAPDGGGIFLDPAKDCRNAWASLFAWQALRFLHDPQMSALDLIRAVAGLI